MILLQETSSFASFLENTIQTFWGFTGFANCEWTNIVMLLVGCFFVYLAIKKNFEPLLLVPIGFGMLIGNIPFQRLYSVAVIQP